MLRGKYGQGMAATTKRSITNDPAYAHQAGGGTDGEYPGVGSVYRADINERANKSNPRNQGPERASSLVAAHSLPIATKSGRNTGRIGG